MTDFLREHLVKKISKLLDTEPSKPKEDNDDLKECDRTSCSIGITNDRRISMSFLNERGHVIATQTMGYMYAEIVRDMLDASIASLKKTLEADNEKSNEEIERSSDESV